MPLARTFDPARGTVRSALADAYARLRREGSMRDHLGDLTSFDDFTAMVGLPKHLANEQLDR